MTKDTGRASLPGLPVVRSGNVELDRWIAAAAERLEVREGARGNPWERVVTLRDLQALGLDPNGLAGRGAASGPLVQQQGGNFSRISSDAFSAAIVQSRAYRELSRRLDDPARFEALPEQVRSLLLLDIAAEAAARGAAIERVESQLQSATSSLAMRVDEITASVQGVRSGVRETTFAAAELNRATAGRVTQLQARLDGVGGVTIEESLQATADRVDGLAGEYMLKVNAGLAVAGIGLAASEDPSGATESSFIVQAGKFAVTGAYNFAQDTTPSATQIGQLWYSPALKKSYRAGAVGTGSWVEYTPTVPFGVNSATGEVFINGSLRINAAGVTLGETTGGAIGQGTKVQFSVDGISLWHDIPSTTDSYMRSGTSSDGGVTWSYSGSVKIKGEQGPEGSTGSTGSSGSRGAAFATSTAASPSDSAFFSASGVSAINGDQLLLSNASGSTIYTRQNGSWVNTTALSIHGDAVITGTLSLGKLTSGSASTTEGTFRMGGSSLFANYNALIQALVPSGQDRGAIGGATFSVNYPAIYGINQGSGYGGGFYNFSGSTKITQFVGGFTSYAGIADNLTSGRQVILANASYALYSASGKGKFYATDGVGPFTGVHDGVTANDPDIGDVMVDLEILGRESVSSTVASFGVSSTANQRGVIGVCSEIFINPPVGWGDSEVSDGNPPNTPIPPGHRVIHVNALGEGQINVCGEGGDLLKGDLIMSSSTPGKGMRQSDDLVRSYTVAKARENVTFSGPTDVKMVACIYLCG